MPYTILITPAAEKQLDSLPKKIRRQINQHILRLKDDPVPGGAKVLQGSKFDGLLRIRSGDYRVIYEIQQQDLTVTIWRIGDRKDVYR